MPDFTDLISQAKKMQEKMKETQEALKKIFLVKKTKLLKFPRIKLRILHKQNQSCHL